VEEGVQARPKHCIDFMEEDSGRNDGMLGWNLEVSFRTE